MYKLKLLLLSLLITGAGTLQAQTFDVSADNMLAPANGSTISNEVELLRFTYTNHGDTIKGASGDTVRFTLLVDGTPAFSFNRDMTTDFATNKTDTVTTIAILSFIPAGAHDLCIVSSIIGQTDNDATNDTTCSSVTVEQFDLSIEAFTIDTPDLEPGDSLEMNSLIAAVSFTIRNNGNVTFLGELNRQNGTLFLPFTLSVDGVVSNLSITSTQQNPINIPAGQTSTVSGSIRNLNIMSPSTAKTFDICLATNLTRDADNSNDQHCETFKTFDPAAVPNSVQDVEQTKSWKITPMDQGFVLNGFYAAQQEISVRVLSITGAEVLNQSLMAEGQINEQVELQTPAGVYLVQVIHGAEVLHTERIYKK